MSSETRKRCLEYHIGAISEGWPMLSKDRGCKSSVQSILGTQTSFLLGSKHCSWGLVDDSSLGPG